VKHERATEETREMAALYALGVLSQHEASSFELHLREGCQVCEEELRKSEQAAARIGLTADEAEPPDYVKDLLLARVERERRILPEPKAPEKQPIAPVPTQTVVVQPHSEKRRSGIPIGIAAGFAIALVLAFLFWNFYIKPARETDSRLQEQKLAEAETEIDGLKQQLSRPPQPEQTRPPVEMEKIIELATKPDVKIARLTGQPATPNDTGVVFWDALTNKCTIIGSFTPAPQGKNYQLWFSTPDGRIPVGLLSTDVNGRIFTTIDAPQYPKNVLSMIVSQEPETGSSSPRGPWHATGKIDP